MVQSKKSSHLPKLYKGYIGSSAVFVFLTLFASALNYIYYPVIARFLTTPEFGVTQALLAILLQISAIFSGLSLVTIYLVRKLGSDEARQSIGILQKITTTLFILATVGITLAQTAVLHFLHLDKRLYLFIISLDLITSVPFIIAFGFLQARKRFAAAGILQLSVVLTKLVLGGLMAKRFGASGALAGIAVGQVVGMAIFGLGCRLTNIPAWEHKIIESLKPPSLADLRFILPMAKNILSIFAVNVMLALFISFDIIAARHYFTPSFSGLYSGASTLSNAIVFVCLPLIGVLLANLDGNYLKASKVSLFKTSSMVLCVMIGGVIVLRLMPGLLLGIFGSNYKIMGYLLWRLGILMSLVAGMSLTLQVGAFYRPLRTALICLLGLIALIIAVMHRHLTPVSFVSTIMAVFATILVVSSVHLIWIYGQGNRNAG